MTNILEKIIEEKKYSLDLIKKKKSLNVLEKKSKDEHTTENLKRLLENLPKKLYYSDYQPSSWDWHDRSIMKI